MTWIKWFPQAQKQANLNFLGGLMAATDLVGAATLGVQPAAHCGVLAAGHLPDSQLHLREVLCLATS